MQTVEPYWPALFAKLFAKKSIGDLIASVGSGEQTPQTISKKGRKFAYAIAGPLSYSNSQAHKFVRSQKD